MKLAVVGSRGFNDYELLKSKLDKIHSVKPISVIVSGGAQGADSLGERWARENRIEILIFLPEWDKYGKSAGYKRNVQIIESADAVIAFWDGESKGTQHSINIAKEKNKPTAIIRYETHN
jgi:hypothetical protein